MSDAKFIIWHDTLGSEANTVECLSYEGKESAVTTPPLGAGDFVVVHDAEQKTDWMAQVVEPQRNLPLQGLSRDSPSEVAVFERILQGDIEKSIFLKQVYYYRLQLIGEIVEKGRLTAVRRRPRAGSVGHIASASDVRKALDLPAVETNAVGKNNIVGRIHSTDIPIAVDWATFKQHVLVAGATGSGKSNTVANLIKAAQSYDGCIIIYDQKPDYQNIRNPNDEERLFAKWTPDVAKAFGLAHVAKYCLWQGAGEKGTDEQAIAVRVSDVALNMLVNALFPYPDEGNQRDVFQALVSYYKHAVLKGKDWTLNGFSTWVRDGRSKKTLSTIAESQGWGTLNDMTLDAMQRKMNQRKMQWLDSMEDATPGPAVGGIFGPKSDASAASGPTGYFVPLSHLQRGKVLVIRTNADGREYGLFLSYMLRQVYNLRRTNQVDFPIINIVDEAQDIFQGDTGIRDTATATMNEIIRKGRSKDISFVIAVQSVSQVPDSVLTNMNTRFIHRQNSVEELRKAIPSASRDLMATSLTFGPGEALASVIGARSVVQAEMAPSPFELTKISAATRKTLAEQDEEAEQNNGAATRSQQEESEEVPF